LIPAIKHNTPHEGGELKDGYDGTGQRYFILQETTTKDRSLVGDSIFLVVFAEGEMSASTLCPVYI